jgi:hypothetical protein
VLIAIAVIAIVLVCVVIFGPGYGAASFINIAAFTAVLVGIAFAGRAILKRR